MNKIRLKLSRFFIPNGYVILNTEEWIKSMSRQEKIARNLECLMIMNKMKSNPDNITESYNITLEYVTNEYNKTKVL